MAMSVKTYSAGSSGSSSWNSMLILPCVDNSSTTSRGKQRNMLCRPNMCSLRSCRIILCCSTVTLGKIFHFMLRLNTFLIIQSLLLLVKRNAARCVVKSLHLSRCVKDAPAINTAYLVDFLCYLFGFCFACPIYRLTTLVRAIPFARSNFVSDQHSAL